MSTVRPTICGVQPVPVPVIEVVPCVASVPCRSTRSLPDGFAAFLAAYTRVMPLHEWRLIREGNTAVALVLGGAMLGFAIPLATAIVRSGNLADMAVWAIVRSDRTGLRRALRRI